KGPHREVCELTLGSFANIDKKFIPVRRPTATTLVSDRHSVELETSARPRSITMSHLSLVEVSSLPPSRHAGYQPHGPHEPHEPDSLEELAAKLATLSKDPSVEQAVETGRLVIEQLYAGDLSAWRSREPKAHSLRALAGRVEV